MEITGFICWVLKQNPSSLVVIFGGWSKCGSLPCLRVTPASLQFRGTWSRRHAWRRNLVLPWQGVDNAVHLFQIICSFCALKSGVMRQVQVIEIIRGVRKSLVTHHFAVIVDEDITHDGIYPSFEIGIGSILLFVIQSFQGCSCRRSLASSRSEVSLYAKRNKSSWTPSRSFLNVILFICAMFFR